MSEKNSYSLFYTGLFQKITSGHNGDNVSQLYWVFFIFFLFCILFLSQQVLLTLNALHIALPLLAAQIVILLLYMLISLLWTETLNIFTREKQINDFLRELNNSV